MVRCILLFSGLTHALNQQALRKKGGFFGIHAYIIKEATVSREPLGIMEKNGGTTADLYKLLEDRFDTIMAIQEAKGLRVCMC